MSIYDDPGFVAWEELPSRQRHASLRSSYLAMAETGRSALVVFDDERPICLVTVGFIRRAWRALMWSRSRSGGSLIKCPMKRSGVFDHFGPP